MNLLYDNLPQTVKVGGGEYGVLTDFRDWIRFSDLITDDKLELDEKIAVMHEWYEADEPNDITDMIKGLTQFYVMGESKIHEEDEEQNQDGEQEASVKDRRPLYSFEEDAAYIIGGFLECYGIDLIEIPYMHWWKFRSLLMSLNEDTEFKKRVAYRSIDVSKIKDSNERKRIQRIQADIALKKSVSDEDIADALDALM